MKNKKGFTLIELLAVIIILGILMLIAIPSVTSYINNSRKNTYAETAANYVKGTIPLVNEGNKLQLYDEHVLFLIPVGNNKEKSCVSLESGGGSPFNGTYTYAYVGVTYNNDKGSYTYYFTAKDASGNGFDFVKYDDLAGKDAKSLVKAGSALTSYAKLNNAYNNADGATYVFTNKDDAGLGTSVPSDVTKVQILKVSECS